MMINFWTEMVKMDVPDFVECLEKYHFSMDDEIRRFPMQYYTLRIISPETFYVKMPEMGYMALDPITPHDAVVHFVRDPAYRHSKKKYIDIGKAFVIYSFFHYNLNRMTLCVNDGADHAFLLAKLLGFIHEGTFRKCRKLHGEFIDVHIFGILKGEI